MSGLELEDYVKVVPLGSRVWLLMWTQPVTGGIRVWGVYDSEVAARVALKTDAFRPEEFWISEHVVQTLGMRGR